MKPHSHNKKRKQTDPLAVSKQEKIQVDTKRLSVLNDSERGKKIAKRLLH